MTSLPAHIEQNDQFKQALDLLENTARHVFITGKAGTGKSTLLDCFRILTKKKIVVLAPTGVAAVNVRGETIHSFFTFKPGITVEKAAQARVRKKGAPYARLDAIVIDEISMVRADLLDCVDAFMRRHGREPGRPFGGAQMIFIGDLYQLPPVVTARERVIFTSLYRSPYFFDARAMQDIHLEQVELEKIYRQKEESFIAILNAIRNNSLTDEQLSRLNSRVLERPPSRGYSVHLTAMNDQAAHFNAEHLDRLRGRVRSFAAEVHGDFTPDQYPADHDLRLKTGAQVMLLNNDSAGRWVNGTIGKIIGFETDEKGTNVLMVSLADESIVAVTPYTWEIFHYSYDEKAMTILTDTVGSFVQYPVRLAWALTIHKSQGKTFDRISVDFGRSVFACGQAYVALSRCTTFNGLTLDRPLRRNEVFVDWRIVQYLTGERSERAMPLAEKVRMIEQVIMRRSALEIVYLKANDEKSVRVVRPLSVGLQSYLDNEFTGMVAFCTQRGENRSFRVDRILSMKLIA